MATRYRQYNMVDNDDHLYNGILLTDKEKEKYWKLENFIPKTKKIKTKVEDIYFCFGARFSSNVVEI